MSADTPSPTGIESWLKSGKYLPQPLRDFHDQKDVFKAMHEIIDVEGHEYAKGVDWVSGQCYVIDIFLWWMARRGYTLQRTRRRGEYRDLQTDVAHGNAERVKKLNQLFSLSLGAKP